VNSALLTTITAHPKNNESQPFNCNEMNSILKNLKKEGEKSLSVQVT
jgi:hypothetical protein